MFFFFNQQNFRPGSAAQNLMMLNLWGQKFSRFVVIFCFSCRGRRGGRVHRYVYQNLKLQQESWWRSSKENFDPLSQTLDQERLENFSVRRIRWPRDPRLGGHFVAKSDNRRFSDSSAIWENNFVICPIVAKLPKHVGSWSLQPTQTFYWPLTLGRGRHLEYKIKFWYQLHKQTSSGVLSIVFLTSSVILGNLLVELEVVEFEWRASGELILASSHAHVLSECCAKGFHLFGGSRWTKWFNKRNNNL